MIFTFFLFCKGTFGKEVLHLAMFGALAKRPSFGIQLQGPLAAFIESTTMVITSIFGTGMSMVTKDRRKHFILLEKIDILDIGVNCLFLCSLDVLRKFKHEYL